MKKLLVILMLAFVVLAIITQVDDDLSKESISLIDRVHSKGTSESYLYLYGIFASDGENPVNVGRKILEEYRKLDVDSNYNITAYPNSKKIPVHHGCRIRNLVEADVS